MTTQLWDLDACFEGVIPSIVATVAPDGTPNISFLSHVVRVDDAHVALSNQFFTKTARNIRANKQAALLLVDAREGTQVCLDLSFVESRDTGRLFEDVAAQLRATSAQIGMADVMRLRGLDIYFVESVSRPPTNGATKSDVMANRSLLRAAADLTEAIAAQTDIEGIVDVVLDGLATQFGYERLMILNLDAEREVLTTLGSKGYEHSGVGSEVPVGHGIIGAAAAERRVLKVSDLSRVQRFARAIHTSSDENRTRTIALPSTIDGMSQIGVPLIAQGLVHGVLFGESRERFAFTGQDEAALEIVARQTAAAFAFAEHIGQETQAPQAPAPSYGAVEKNIQVKHYGFDDSVFIDNAYVIKGVPGRLLVYMIEAHQREGRSEFTNRELRLASELKLPSIRDNLETRLVLLRRRLSEKNAPIQLVRVGRGRFALQLQGRLSLHRLVDPAGSSR